MCIYRERDNNRSKKLILVHVSNYLALKLVDFMWDKRESRNEFYKIFENFWIGIQHDIFGD